MCGLAGILNKDPDKPVDVGLLNAMSEMIAHRGPDGAGVYASGPVGLVHRRLAVLDLSELGSQPMVDPRRGTVLVYNGEIYNYRELRRRLQSDGIQFRSNCDTEVLCLSDLQNLDWLGQLNGMFAFAVWNPDSRQLTLGRDHMGIKPLYYAETPSALIFASEIKPLLLHPEVQRLVNAERLTEFLAFRTTAGCETLYRGIYRLPPGHVMTIDQASGSKHLKSFAAGKALKAEYSRSEDPVDALERVLSRSVTQQLVSDVPVGTFNSGGVDSSLVTAMACRANHADLHTFSVGFDDPDYDESEYARAVAKRYGTRHHSVVISHQEYLDEFEETLRCLEEPINHAHTVHLRHLCRYAREHVTVALTGEGADELFAGYPRLQIPLLARYLRVLPEAASSWLVRKSDGADHRIRKLFEVAHSLDRAVLENARFVPQDTLAKLVGLSREFNGREAALRGAERDHPELLSRILAFEQSTYLPSLLTRIDKVSMYSGLECRVPFLDPRVIEFSFAIPARLKLRVGRENKWILKKLARKYLDPQLVDRPKSGFGVPLAKWLRNPKGLGQYLDLLRDKQFRDRGYFDAESVHRLVAEHSKGEVDHSEALWGLINIELWTREFIDRPVLDQSSRCHDSHAAFHGLPKPGRAPT